MAKAKRNNNQRSTLRFVTAFLLAVMLLAATVVSFAWFRNIISIDGADMSTGNFKYQFAGYYKNSEGTVINDFKFSTEAENGFTQLSKSENVTATSQGSSLVTPTSHGEIYYVVKKLDGSIPLDVSLQIDAAIETLEEVGGFWYYIEVKTGKTANLENSDVDTIRAASFPTEFTQTGVGETNELLKISQDVRRTTLSDNDYWCVRLSYGLKSGAISPSYTGKQLSVYPKLSVAQTGGLPEDESKATVTYTVNRLYDLEAALSSYTPGAEIRIVSDITYNGDLIFNRPVILKIQGATLTVKGDVRFTYTGRGNFTLNTSQNGYLAVTKASDASGGNLYVELPNAGMNLIGKNEADITLEKSFCVEVSNTSGMMINRTEILNFKSNLSTIMVRGNSFIEVSKYTSVSEIEADSSVQNLLYAVKIVNYGTIGAIDLWNASNGDVYVQPRIYIDNYSVITSPIELPSWSERYYTETGLGNTRVCQNLGASEITVKEANSSFKNVHIEIIGKNILVERVNDDPKNIIVHYAQKVGETTMPTLDGLLREYSTMEEANPLKIADLADLVSVKIITYGDVVLTAEDYVTICRMSALQALDISDATSQGNKVPEKAFANLQNLKTVTMSEADTEWGKNIFFGTLVDEVTVPLNTVTVEKDSFATANGVYVKYIHILQSTTVLDLPESAYVFVPDETAVANYTPGKTFVEATRYATEYGDFFLRNLGYTYAFVVYTGEAQDWYKVFDQELDEVTFASEVKNYSRLDMAVMTLNKETFILGEVGNYALYNRFKLEDTEKQTKFYITLGETVTSIGDYAFTNCSAIVGIEGAGVTYLGQSAFYNCSALVKMSFPSLNKITPVADAYAVTDCRSLKFIETGVVDRNLNDSQAAYVTNKATWQSVDVHVVRSTGEEDVNAISVISIVNYGENHNHVNNIYAIIPANVKSLYSEGIGVYKYSYHFCYLSGRDFDFYPAYGDDIYVLPKFVAETSGGVTRVVVACIIDSIDAADVFTDFPSNASVIGESAFQYVEIKCQNNSSLVIPDSVITIEGAAFFNGASKNYHTLDLNNVVNIRGNYNFNGNSCIFVKGAKVESLGYFAFQFNSVYSIELPSLKRTNSAFVNCSGIRYAYLGPCDSGDDFNNFLYSSRNNIKMIFVDRTKASPTTKANGIGTMCGDVRPPLIVAGSNISISNALMIDSFDDLVLADYEEILCTAGSASGMLYIPKHLMTMEENSMVSVKYCKYLDSTVDGDYTTVSRLYEELSATGDRQTVTFIGDRIKYTTADNGTDVAFTVTSIGSNAFESLDLSSKSVTVGDTVLTLDASAFEGKTFDRFNLNNVTSVGESAFKNGKFKSFDFGALQEIGDYGFDGCTFGTANLQNVHTIGAYAFNNCIIDSIYMPTLQTAGEKAFNGATVKNDFICPVLSEIGQYAFDSASLKEVDFAGLKLVKQYALARLKVSGTLTLSAATQIEWRGLAYTTANEVIANHVVNAAQNAFMLMTVGKISLNKLQSGGEGLFYDTTISSGEIYLPSIVTLVGNSFSSTRVKSVVLGANAREINGIFNAASGMLANVTIQADTMVNGNPFQATMDEVKEKLVLRVKRSAGYPENWQGIKNIEYFDEVSSTEHIEYYFTVIDEGAKTATLSFIDFKTTWTPVSNLTLPSKLVNTDENSSTYNQEYVIVGVDNTMMSLVTEKYSTITESVKLETLTLPHTLQLVDFENTSLPYTLKAFAFTENTDGATTYFKAVDGVLYTADGSILVMYPQGKDGDTFTVSSDVKMIYKNAFYGSKLKTITVEGVVTVLEGAFSECANLVSVTFSSTASVSSFVGANVFKNSYNVQSVFVADSLLDDYKNSAIFASAVREKFKAVSSASTEQGGESTDPTDGE